MADQTTPKATDKDRSLAREWATAVESNPSMVSIAALSAARVVLDTVPATPTLADMTLDEQDECAGMQADLAQGDRVVILDGTPDHDGLVHVLERTLDVYQPSPEDVTPRPDLPRLTWPGTEKPAPAPALPGDWRLADHEKRGRVIVTRTEPNRYGEVVIACPAPDSATRADTFWCKRDKLTYPAAAYSEGTTHD